MILLIVGVAFVLSWATTAVVCKMALSAKLIDYPNERSSHSRPIPRGGGLGIVLVSAVGVGILWLAKLVDSHLAAALVGGGAIIAFTGFMDDRKSLGVSIRLTAHIVAAVWATYALGGLHVLMIGKHLIDLGAIGDLLTVVVTVWTLNLFNFMDGIDGVAASEAIFITCTWAIFSQLTGLSNPILLVSVLLAASCLGFLVWNWPPAKIFMGDVGSGYLGYVVAVLAIADARTNSVAFFIWLTLGGVFFVDATVTLIRRLLRGERVYEAHRGHAYQWLARRWNSHRRVTVLVILINVFWLLPLACCCVLFPRNAWWIYLASLAPLIVLALIAGAGRREQVPST